MIKVGFIRIMNGSIATPFEAAKKMLRMRIGIIATLRATALILYKAKHEQHYALHNLSMCFDWHQIFIIL